jgi:N-acetylmuramoyl-L-alanine amidase
MTITIELAPELENQIKQAAAKVGLSPDAYILESVTQRLQLTKPRPSSVKRLSKREAALLQKINQSLSQIQWQRYRALISKRQAETLTPEEQAELISLSDQLEEANVKRIEYLAQLAVLRKTTVPALIQELGLKPVTHG